MKLLIFLVALASVIACSYAEVKIRHKECVFPFKYKGKTYNYCTQVDDNKYWCSVDAEYKDNFRTCQPPSCTFPFEYKGKTYETCTKAGDASNYWCSKDREFKSDYFECKNFVDASEDSMETQTTQKVTRKVGCIDQEEKVRKLNEEWIHKCSKYRCTDKPDALIEAKCEGKFGCHAVGQNGYTCVVNGKTYDSCSCLRKDNKLYNVAEEVIETVEVRKQKTDDFQREIQTDPTTTQRKIDNNQRETRTDTTTTQRKVDDNQRETTRDDNTINIKETKNENRRRDEDVEDKQEEKKEVTCTDQKRNQRREGEKWDFECNVYQCREEGPKKIQTKCKGKFGCVDVGEKWEIDCQTYQCKEEGVRKIKGGCKDKSGCLDLGYKFDIDCHTYQCKEGGVAKIFAKCKGKSGCHDLGKSGYECVQNGKTYEQCMCSGKGLNPMNLADENSEVVEGCTGADNRKYRIGEKYVHECATYLCAKGGKNQFVSAKCKDLTGQCRDIGSSDYKCSINGKSYEDCVCKGDPQQPYQEGTIPVGAKDVKRTQIKLCFDPTGKESNGWKDGCTEFVCDNGETRVKRQRCRDDEDKCYDLNTKNPCVMSGRKWKACECEMFGDAPTLNASNG